MIQKTFHTLIAAGDHLLDLASGLEVPGHLALHSSERHLALTNDCSCQTDPMTAAHTIPWQAGRKWWTYYTAFVLISQ